MKKRIFCIMLVLCLCMVMVLAGCGNLVDPINSSSNLSSDPSSNPSSDSSSDPSSDPSSNPSSDSSSDSSSTPSVPQEISLNRDDFSLFSKGSTWRLYNGTVPVKDVTFTSGNTKVCTFVNGVVTAVGPGSTKVYAEYNGVKLSCWVYCSWNSGSSSSNPSSKPNSSSSGTGSTVGSRNPVKAPPAAFSGPSSFYNDAAFIGDSVSMMLRNQAIKNSDLGRALFLTRGSFGVRHAVNGTMKLTYQGVEMFPEDILAASGVKKVFIMLGMNDLNINGLQGTVDYYATLISRIQKKCPDIKIYIQSMTPVYTGGESGYLNNASIDQYNIMLKNLAQRTGCYYVDIASYLKDGTNGLAPSYCSDKYVHLTPAGADVWIKVLKAYAGY